MRALAFAALLIGGTAAGAAPSCTQGLCYIAASSPTGYNHPIFATLPEWDQITYAGGSFRFEQGFIEDTAPHLADVTGDGAPEALVAHTVAGKGTRLVVLSLPGLHILAATPHIGAHHRWLAIIGAGDFGGDGQIEIAYIDRPHLRAELVFLRLQNGALREIDRQAGLTNHRIGDDSLGHALRPCAQDIVLHSADWSRIMAAAPSAPARDLGRYTPANWAKALRCAL